MLTIAGVRFKKAGKIYYFDPEGLNIQKDQDVIVETSRGIEFGKAVLGLREISKNEIISPLKPIIRIATDEDKETNAENLKGSIEALKICEEKIEEHKLSMRLIDVEYTFDKKKIIFYFTAEGRIDFRELVKDLAQIFRTRIELRQIGVRDEAKVVEGVGICGRTFCCSTFLGEFQPVSIKMAKEQNLSLNPTKISGVCGRLMCCLKYEQDTYEDILAKMPQVGGEVMTPDNGKGIVFKISTLLELVEVKIKKDNKEEIVPYKASELKFEKNALEEESKINKKEIKDIIEKCDMEQEDADLLRKMLKDEK